MEAAAALEALTPKRSEEHPPRVLRGLVPKGRLCGIPPRLFLVALRRVLKHSGLVVEGWVLRM